MCADDMSSANSLTILYIFTTVKQCNAALLILNAQLGGIKEDISIIRHYLQKVAEHTTAVEGRVGSLEDNFPPIQAAKQKHTQELAALFAKTDDLENRLGCNNIHLVGVPEKAEGNNPGRQLR